jgi:hypothetical protein
MRTLFGGLASICALRTAVADRPAAPPEPKLGLLAPVIHPCHYERQFWRSPVFLDATREIDNLNLFTRICENILFLFRSLADIPAPAILLVGDQCRRNLAIAVLHVALKVLCADVYEQGRWALVSHFRWVLCGWRASATAAMFLQECVCSSAAHVPHVAVLQQHTTLRYRQCAERRHRAPCHHKLCD